MRLHENRHIDRPIEQVFDYTADFANSAEWDPGVESSRRVTDGPPREGSEYELMVVFGNRTIPMKYTTTAYEPTGRVVFEGRGETITAVDEIKFTPDERGTLVDYTADLQFTNWMRWIMPLMRPVLNRVGDRALDGLVETLER